MRGKSLTPGFIYNDSDNAGPAAKNWDISTLDEIAPTTPIIIFLESSEDLVNSVMIKLAINEGFPTDHFHLDRDKSGDFTGRVGRQFTGFVGHEIRPCASAVWFDEVAMPNARDTLAQ